MLRGHTGRGSVFPREAGDSSRLLLGGRRDRRREEPLEQQGGGLRLRRALAPELLQKLILASGWGWKPVLHSLVLIHRATIPPPRATYPGPLTVRSPGPGEFCAIAARPGPARLAIAGQGPNMPHPVLGHKRRPVAARRRGAQNILHPALKSNLCSLGEAAIKIARHAARAAPKTLAFGRPLPALAASQPKDGERHYDAEER